MAEDVASDRWGDEGEHKGRVRDGGSERGAVVEVLAQSHSAGLPEGRITGESPRAFLPFRGASPRFLVLGFPFLPIPAP